MSVEIITKEDLQLFRRQLLEDLQQLLSKKQHAPTQRQILKSAEVRRLLKIAPATLQTLRLNGTLPFTKIGGTLYYRYEDIEKLLHQNSSHHPKQGL
ncbi:helix-turn-helix domain-containing protein [Pontibacter qinzhouensis]|uniref:Helix-turn-helix domain-containing protein n=1 Tax=Pontibacter qinzhouensis TaxID=2603253 RepID=A0A5C8JH86_9BACT|nr:helix-turn-helix domain-containing protein [Pontibacter qinzhouensis]TXK37690.1 helix-turn-helix domain-containing protein [Pontibacter qinzhouensis]